MASFKIRRKALVARQFQVSSNGTKLKDIIAGSVTMTAPSLTASGGTGTVNACISGLSSSGHLYKLIVTACAISGSMVLQGAAASNASTDGVVTFTFGNIDHEDAASKAATLAYIAVRDE